MQKYSSVAMDTAGNSLSGALVYVYLTGTTTQATIYSNQVGAGITQPITANTDGTYYFYAPDGRYDIVISKSGYAFTAAATTDVLLHDPNSVVVIPQLTANTNDWLPSTGYRGSIWTTSASIAIDITGISATLSGQVIWLYNSGANAITLKNASSSSVAANRFRCNTAADIVIAQYKSVILTYNTNDTCWMVN